VDGASVSIDRRCNGEPMPRRTTVSVTGVLVGDPPLLVVPCGGIVPAPLLARVTTPREATEPPARTGAVTANGTESPGSLPATLLLLAATTLAAGAGAARWSSRDGTPAVDSGPVAPEGAEEAMSPPALTLVSLPRERAP
jgi:hypothetical protein